MSDEFKSMTDAAFASEAENYLVKLLTNLELTQIERTATGQEPLTLRDLAMRITTEVHPDKQNNVAVALAAALFKLSRPPVFKDECL